MPDTAARSHDASSMLRKLGSRAHQLRAATRAADHFNAQDNDNDRSTGSWLMSCALTLAEDLAVDIDVLARTVREANGDAGTQQKVAALRVRAHQLHAATRAADHFLDQDSREDHDTGSWLIACASGLAEKLAAELDDGVATPRRPGLDKQSIEPHDAQLARRLNAATAAPHATPIRGAA
jgi:hypothetical protein